MFFNHVKVAFRQLTRNKAFSGFNILGLTLGLALFILIAVFIRSELGYDQWLEDVDLTYRVYRIGDNGETAWTPSLLAQKMQAEYPEVAAASGWAPNGDLLASYAANDWYLDNTAAVDSNFFQVVSMEFAQGDRETALADPNSIVLSDELATRIFADKNPIGEVLRIDDAADYIVAGVLTAESKKSHITSDAFMRFQNYGEVWRFNSRSTYVRLKPNADPAGLAVKVKRDVNELIKQEYIANGNSVESARLYDWALQPVSSTYLHSEGWTAQGEQGSFRYVLIFGLIALIVLLVAVVNYVNLTTAQASQRSKEVGVRKVTGAGRGLLASQFIMESILVAMVAAIFAIGLAEACLSYFNQMIDRDLALLQGDWTFVVFGTIALALLTGILAGSYPAFVMSGFQPVKALKSNFRQSGNSGAFRKVLVVSQFAICITLLIVMAFIYRQVNFMINEELGFEPDQVVTIPINDYDETPDKILTMKNRFKQIPGVREVTMASAFPGGFLPDWNMNIEGRDDSPAPHVLFADEDFAKTLDIEILQGRFISNENEQDHQNNFIVNEEFISRYGIDEPIGARIKWDYEEAYGQIVGVVRNFHFRGLNEKIEPLVMNADNWRSAVGIKIESARVEQALPALKELWAEIEPVFPMRYSFLDDDFAALYSKHERLGSSILYATLLTLFIALLGLFGLTAFTVQRRTKEIGIRKVLGSSVAAIVALLAREHLKLLAIACAIALPLSYFLANNWIADFAYRTTLVWWVFVGAAVLILVLGFLTVSLQTTRAALANPMESLQTE